MHIDQDQDYIDQDIDHAYSAGKTSISGINKTKPGKYNAS